MGKKPVVGLIGLVWAGIALTGCGECCRNLQPHRYEPKPYYSQAKAKTPAGLEGAGAVPAGLADGKAGLPDRTNEIPSAPGSGPGNGIATAGSTNSLGGHPVSSGSGVGMSPGVGSVTAPTAPGAGVGTGIPSPPVPNQQQSLRPTASPSADASALPRRDDQFSTGSSPATGSTGFQSGRRLPVPPPPASGLGARPDSDLPPPQGGNLPSINNSSSPSSGSSSNLGNASSMSSSSGNTNSLPPVSSSTPDATPLPPPPSGAPSLPPPPPGSSLPPLPPQP